MEKPKGLIFYCHANDGALDYWGTLGEYFNNLGYDIVMMDYAGYGKSDPKLTTEKRLFGDIQLLYDTMKTLYSEDQIVVYGRSMGTGIASSLLVNNSPKMLILETPYYNLKKLVRFYAIAPVPVFFVRWNLANNEHILSSGIPVYIFSGTADEIIPHQQSIDLANLRDGVELYAIENGKHSDLDKFPEFHRGLGEVLD
ncbi:MAG: alpha/beta fold hydrolase [Flavobacteriales bacterium]|nr:alpha/beta fold hydrolase [Flavobacteriales bacterium]